MTDDPEQPPPREPGTAAPKRNDIDRRYRIAGDPLETLKVVLAIRNDRDS